MRVLVCLVASGLVLSGCATRSTAPSSKSESKIEEALTAPLVDLNLLQTKIPEILIQATKDPYHQPEKISCNGIIKEVTALNDALGPDMDASRSSTEPGLLEQGGNLVGNSAIDALRGTTQDLIPFRSWVRRLTGAESHSKEVASAIAAGIVRRAYLKGIGESLGCHAPAAPLQHEDADK
jgi:hypothetical protein